MASIQGSELPFLDNPELPPSALRQLVHVGSGWDHQPSPPVLTSPDCARHHSGSGPKGPCAFLAVTSPDPDVFLGPHPFLCRRRPLWDPGCTTLPPPLLGCRNPRAVSQVPSTLKPHLPALLSLPSPWLWGVPVRSVLPESHVRANPSPVCVEPSDGSGHPPLSTSQVTLGEGHGAGSLTDPPLCLVSLSDFTSPTQGSPLPVRG